MFVLKEVIMKRFLFKEKNMKKIALLTVLITLAAAVSVFAHTHKIEVGQTYSYEWKIVNVSSGAIISSGSDTVVPATRRGYRDMEHYIRGVVFGWSSWTRTIDGVRQRLTINLLDCELDGHD